MNDQGINDRGMNDDGNTHDRDDSGTGSRDTYYAEARSWARDREAARARSSRAAWVVAGIASGIAVLEALALIGLAPLKTVVPYTLLVDRNTGFVEALDGTSPPAIRPQEALTQSLLAQYVVARETYDVATVSEQYRKVALWSADAARTDYLALMPADNPESPLHRFGRGAIVTTRVESVSPIAPDTAMVRFATERRDQNRGQNPGQPPTEYWVAVLRYRFSGEPMTVADRLVNPLGFQVVRYRRDQEAPPPAGEEGTATVTVAGTGPNATAAPEAAVAGDQAAGPAGTPETPTVVRSAPPPGRPGVFLPPYVVHRQPWRAPTPTPPDDLR